MGLELPVAGIHRFIAQELERLENVPVKITSFRAWDSLNEVFRAVIHE
jgi:hypothetical protein